MGQICVATEGSYDYLHTRTSLLKNHLRSEGSALYLFLHSNEEVGMHLARFWDFTPSSGTEGEILGVLTCHACSQMKLTAETWQTCAAFRIQEQPADMDQPHNDSPSLDSSVAQVQHQTMGNSTEDCSFLMSSGRGDMVGLCSTCLGCNSSSPALIILVFGLAKICERCVGAGRRKLCFLVGAS